MTSTKIFFNQIDLSKLDTATSSLIREDILTLSDNDWNLIDNDSEMQKQMEIIKHRLETEFPTSIPSDNKNISIEEIKSDLNTSVSEDDKVRSIEEVKADLSKSERMLEVAINKNAPQVVIKNAESKVEKFKSELAELESKVLNIDDKSKEEIIEKIEDSIENEITSAIENIKIMLEIEPDNEDYKESLMQLELTLETLKG